MTPLLWEVLMSYNDPSLINTQEAMADKMAQILNLIPFIDMTDDNLHETPKRIARMYTEVFWGLDPANLPRMTTFPSESPNLGMIGTGKIFFTSFCAHHLLPFTGYAHCFYIPYDRVLGISKFTRIVNYYAARPQIQERLATQIADHIMQVTDCEGCFVVLRATHGCMQCRGVKQEGAVMVTSVIRPYDWEEGPVGPFAKFETRNEALMLMEMEK